MRQSVVGSEVFKEFSDFFDCILCTYVVVHSFGVTQNQSRTGWEYSVFRIIDELFGVSEWGG